MTFKFRPSHACLKWKIKNNPVGDYNYVPRRHLKESIHRIAGQLHYLGSHSYVTAKWKIAEKKFFNRYKKYL